VVHSRAVCARRAERAGAAPPHRAPLRRLPLRGFPTRRTRSSSCTRRSATRMRCSTRTMALLGRSSLSLTPCSTPSATSTYCEHPKPCPGAILIQGEGGGGGSGAAQAEVGAVGCRGRGGRCRVGGGGAAQTARSGGLTAPLVPVLHPPTQPLRTATLRGGTWRRRRGTRRLSRLQGASCASARRRRCSWRQPCVSGATRTGRGREDRRGNPGGARGGGFRS
jgi:hypothetical protein